MAKPRVFISSTFYDLRHIREDLERVIRELGYEPVRHETGSVPYAKSEPPESGAYREAELADIVVSIIGSRYGSESRDETGYSISQVELKRALDRGVQVFIFVESGVLTEFRTFQLNRDRPDTKYSAVDDVRVFEFVEQLYKLPKNNSIFPFETSTDILATLKQQWAGLFQRFLSEQSRVAETRVLDEMNAVARTLKEVVAFLTEERKSRDDAIKTILLTNHPAFRRLRELTNTPYRVFFSDRDEMESWLRARRWQKVDSSMLDEDSEEEWFLEGNQTGLLKFRTTIFDPNDKLLLYSDEDWEDDWIVFTKTEKTASAVEEDDIPF